MGDYPDWTDLVHLVGTDIMLAVDIQGAYIMMPVDIQAQYVNVEVDIVAQTIGNIGIDLAAQSVGDITIDIAAQSIGTLAVGIVASTVTLDITLHASDITLNIDIDAQSVGVYLQTEWETKEGHDKNFRSSGTSKNWGGNTYFEYEVPAGKTLYITGVSYAIFPDAAADYDHHLHFWLEMYQLLPLNRYVDIGGEGGGAIMLTKPIVIPHGKAVQGKITNKSNVSCTVVVCAWGYEI